MLEFPFVIDIIAEPKSPSRLVEALYHHCHGVPGQVQSDHLAVATV